MLFSSRRSVIVLVLSLVTRTVRGCGSIGNADDARLFTNPTLQWNMSPPAAWTYPVSYAQLTGQYFPGQPLTQSDATTQSQGDISSAVLASLAENSVPTQGVRVTAGYTPQEVSDCVKVAATNTGGTTLPQQTDANTPFGMEEQGAIVRIAQSGAQITIANCAAKNYGSYTYRENIVQGTAQIDGITVSGYTLRQIAAQLQVALSFNYHVRFRSEITYS